MLLRSIGILSGVIALILCGCTGAFTALRWLWVLPVSFLGSFLTLFGIAFLYLYIKCAQVDTSVPQEGEDPLYRRIAKLYVEAVVSLVQARVHTTGMEQLPKEGRFMLVCNHLNDMDPVILLNQFRDKELAFISKRENSTMFIVGKIMHKLQSQLINRENDREALKTILKCISILKEDKASIAVFPEGYIKGDSLLHHFRSGVFKIALKARVPIVVCTLQNTQFVFHNAKRLKPTDVQLHLVGVIPPEELEGVTAVNVSERVYAMMAADLGPDLVAAE